jgi:hypothetical protein
VTAVPPPTDKVTYMTPPSATTTPRKRPKATATPARPKLRKFLVYLDPADHEKLRRLAFQRRVSIAALVRDAVGDWLKRNPE